MLSMLPHHLNFLNNVALCTPLDAVKSNMDY
jgi:hypothetical protein